MCYDIKSRIESQLKRARHYNNTNLIADLENHLKPFQHEDLFHASGYTHPKLFIYTNTHPFTPILSIWGLIPAWVKDNNFKSKIWNQTLNARSETIFTKPSFKTAAKEKHCIIYLDGFYEHHHVKGKTYPFYIHKKNDQPMAIGGLWENWTDKATGEIIHSFSIVTTRANTLMTQIHNNPKLAEPRMPLILSEEKANEWLKTHNQLDVDRFLSSVHTPELIAHTVRPIRGKNASGNTSSASTPFKYAVLE